MSPDGGGENMTDAPIQNPPKHVGTLEQEITSIGGTTEWVVPNEESRTALGLDDGERIVVDSVGERLEIDDELQDAMEDERRVATVLFAVREENGDLVAEYVSEPLADN